MTDTSEKLQLLRSELSVDLVGCMQLCRCVCVCVVIDVVCVGFGKKIRGW